MSVGLDPRTRTAPRRPPPRPFWEHAYAAVLAVLDAVVVSLASAIALAVRFGSQPEQLSVTGSTRLSGISYVAVVAAATPTWIAVLAASRAYEPRFLGTGSEEFKRIANGTIRFTALLTFTAFAAKVDLSRAFVAVALPLGLLLLVIERFAVRKGLHALRHRNRCLHRAVAVGSIDEVEALVRTIQREPYAGLKVIAVSLPAGETRVPDLEGVVVLGHARVLASQLEPLSIDTVAVAGSSALSSRELRELAWDLEGRGIDLVVAPALTDVTGPRIHVRPVAGLPLLHVEEPTFGGGRRLVKAVIDYLGALGLALLLLLPGLVVAVLIKRDDPGPVFYRQERVGKDGRSFRMWKFRTMRVGADREVEGLAQVNEAAGPLFKMREDPRVTRVGSRLRRYSLDELPQLLNVLRGEMSLVGPRPPLQREVDVYADHAHRRLLVKPGMTGLWQVSGRSDLDWEETVRLDLYYVENWSVALDGMIMWKTVFAVIKGHGAY